MYFADGILPLLDGAEVMIEDCQVQRAVAIGFPWLIDMWTASDVQGLQLVYQQACRSHEQPAEPLTFMPIPCR